MFNVEYVYNQTLRAQPRASFTGATNLARMMKRKGAVSVSVTDANTGKEVYRLR
jgi:hypothetical protein